MMIWVGISSAPVYFLLLFRHEVIDGLSDRRLLLRADIKCSLIVELFHLTVSLGHEDRPDHKGIDRVSQKRQRSGRIGPDIDFFVRKLLRIRPLRLSSI